ncbi:MAG: glycosyltransferase family 2 protein [Clostridia bacterium]|nr:glycosyltransferase family 2 protein [Clostridia bacterium]
MIELTILMPCLNEEKTLAFSVNEAMDYLKKSGISGEVLIADNGSTDSSATLAASLGARVTTVPEKGYGSALIGGINAARGKYIIMGDCDGSYDFSSLDGFVAKLRCGHKLVMGNRFKGGIEKGAMPFLHKLGVPALSLIARLRYNTHIGDFHCGLRGFDREAALSLGLSCKGMEFATEMIGRFALSGADICEIPTVLRRDKRNGHSHLHTFRDGWRHLKLILFFKL